MREEVYWLALNAVEGVGPILFRKLLTRYSTPREVLEASREELITIPRINEKIAREIEKSAQETERIEEELVELEDNGVEILTFNMSVYPENLRNISRAPPVLFIKGEIKKKDHRAVAIVGSREATTQGIKVAEELAKRLSEAGFTIISGFARGIDTAAHGGALENRGRTIAVFGSGINIIHPRENSPLVEEICHQGAALSECFPNEPPSSGRLLARDRIISGLSLGVIIVESGEGGGAVDTARHAQKQGRAVFAIDWSEKSAATQGNEQLLKEGAQAIRNYKEVTEIITRLKRVKVLPENQVETSQLRLF